MRRSDREVRDLESILNIIHNCSCCRLGFVDDAEVYIVPLNFGFERKEETLVFYFHSAKEGRKIDLIAKNPRVGFELDTPPEIYAQNGDIACNYSARYQSIIGTGVVSIVTDLEEKKRGLLLLMEHVTQKGDWAFDEKMIDSVAVFKLEVAKLSCKEHK